MQKKAKGGISKDRFALWLKSQKAFEGVDSFSNEDAYDNPIATYLTDTRNHVDVVVGQSFIEYARPNGRAVAQALPEWATKFQQNFKGNSEVAVDEALDFLSTLS